MPSIPFLRRPLVLCLLCCALSLSACEKTGKELLREASTSIAQKKPDEAEKTLALALKRDPSLLGNVQRQQSRVYVMRKEYDQAERVLLERWNDQSLDTKDLNTKQKQERQLLADLLTDLYRTWAESIDAKAQPKKYEEVLTKGIKRDANNPRLNTLLVDFYFEHAEKLIQQKSKADAAAMLDKIYELRTTPQRRAESKTRASNLRVEVYNDATQARFDETIKPKLVEENRYDETRRLVLFPIESDVDRRLKPGREEDEKAALVLASKDLDERIEAMVRTVHAFDQDVKLTGRPKNVEIMEKKLERGKYTLKASIPLSDIVYYGRIMKQRDDKAKNESEADSAKTPAAQDSPENTPAPTPTPAAP